MGLKPIHFHLIYGEFNAGIANHRGLHLKHEYINSHYITIASY